MTGPPTAVPDPEDEGPSSGGGIVALSGGTVDNCPTDPPAGCRIENDQCLCTLTGITVTATPDPPTPPPPWMPDPPGWVDEPDLSGGGGGDGGGGDEDACDRFGSCGATVELGCDVGVTRSQVGRCTLTVDPPATPLQIDRWWFSGDGAVVDGGSWDGMTWEGPLVLSGQVKVEGKASGVDFQATSFIQVTPRTGSQWIWSPGSGITYNAGGLTNPPLPWPVNRIGILCHASAGCAEGDVPQHQWYVQPQNPVHGNGFTRSQVPSGPNKGLWWVKGVTVDVQMASALNPDYLPGGVARPHGCGASPQLSFYDFNLSPCGVGDPGWGALWTNFAWDHEQLHADQAGQVVGNWEHLDVARALEGLLRDSASELNNAIEARVFQSGRCVTAAVSQHGDYSTGHPLPNFEIWFWNPMSNIFEAWAPGSPTSGTPLDWGTKWIPSQFQCAAPPA